MIFEIFSHYVNACFRNCQKHCDGVYIITWMNNTKIMSTSLPPLTLPLSPHYHHHHSQYYHRLSHDNTIFLQIKSDAGKCWNQSRLENKTKHNLSIPKCNESWHQRRQIFCVKYVSCNLVIWFDILVSFLYSCWTKQRTINNKIDRLLQPQNSIWNNRNQLSHYVNFPTMYNGWIWLCVCVCLA